MAKSIERSAGKADSRKLKTESPHLRDAESIGKAWGIAFYDQNTKRKIRMEQLAAIKAVMKRPDFPNPVKGKGYPREAVVRYGMAHIKFDAKCRAFEWVESAQSEDSRLKPKVSGLKHKDLGAESPTLASRLQTSDSARVSLQTKDLPPVEKPANGELFDSDARGFEASLDLWEDKLNFPIKWQEAPLQSWQMKHLQAHRPHLFVKESSTPDGVISENITGGQRGVANWIRNNFTGTNPTHTDINNWIKGDYLPVPCKENFPGQDEGGRYKTGPIRVWVEKYLVKKSHGQDLPMTLDYRQAQEKLDYERAAEEFEVWKQSNSDKYVLRDVAEASVVGALKLHHSFVKRQFERGFGRLVMERLSKQGFDHNQQALIAAAIGSCGRDVIAAIESDCGEPPRANALRADVNA